ncbi:GNAT family N-acetyltransferase [Qipengyuania sp. ASV99]|uniref:GNAT family N-acetyltransferase n=1 Tax=Qipengyuania sp. ASV99 TaxID=3399681 RepID=UPI003A4C7197
MAKAVATYVIRPFRESDAADLAEITISAIHTLGARRYSPDQVKVWASRHPGPQRFLDRASAGAVIFVAANAQDAPVAYALLERTEQADGRGAGHLDMLYCHPAHTRRGLADELLGAAQAHAEVAAMARLYTEASELARPAFERAGYHVLHRRDFTIAGVAIHNYAMEKKLGQKRLN